jgi:hypothetical protein
MWFVTKPFFFQARLFKFFSFHFLKANVSKILHARNCRNCLSKTIEDACVLIIEVALMFMAFCVSFAHACSQTAGCDFGDMPGMSGANALDSRENASYTADARGDNTR